MSGQAGASLVSAAMAALREVRGLTGIHEALPLQAAVPHATVEAGLETDWSHKSGIGREVRLTVTLRDHCERPSRLRDLGGDVAAALEGMESALDGWRLVTLNLVRSMTVAQIPRRWALTLDYRVRMLVD